jgi:bifunctional DNase/RNase
MAVKMQVAGMAVDSSNNAPVVVLKEVEGIRAVPIWVGQNEAGAIAAALDGVRPLRPQTHDLLKSALGAAGWRVVKVSVVALREGTFYAEIEMVSDRDRRAVDARPSDAIALALRSGAPIFVDDDVLKRAGVRAAALERERWDAVLAQLSPEDFGRFKQ